MEALALAEAVAGGALVFFVPGFTVAKALFPERRVAGPDGVRWAIELAALGLVLSVVLTIVLGYGLLAAAPGGFSASWSDPQLEVALTAVAVLALVVGLFEGAYRRRPPLPRPREEGPEDDDPWELDRKLDRLQRERLTLQRELARRAAAEGATTAPERERLEAIVAEEATLRRAREEAYER